MAQNNNHVPCACCFYLLRMLSLFCRDLWDLEGLAIPIESSKGWGFMGVARDGDLGQEGKTGMVILMRWKGAFWWGGVECCMRYLR